MEESEKNQNKLILVYYISIANVDDIESYMNNVMKKISSTTVSEDSEIIVIPIYGETKIECINPKYITNSNLIKNHERTMSELHEKLKNQIDQLEESNVKTNG